MKEKDQIKSAHIPPTTNIGPPLRRYKMLFFSDGEQQHAAQSPTGSRRTTSRTGSQKSRPHSTRAEAMAKKKRELKETMEESATELLAHFNHRNLDSLLKVTRNTLEQLRKRITTSSMVHYMGDRGSSTDMNKRDHQPVFRCNAVLAIPNIVMQPTLDEVQQSLNKAAQMIIGVSKVNKFDKKQGL